MLTLRKRGKMFHVRGTIRVGKQTFVVKEHSTGAARREDAEAYRAKYETDIRREAIHGIGGRTHSLTIADASLRYSNRPGGLRNYDLWRLKQIIGVVGEYSLARAGDAWSEFRRIRCAGLSPVTVQRYRSTFSAAVNYLANEEGFDPPRLPRRPKGEKVDEKRVRFLPNEQADRLLRSYAPHVQPIVTLLRWQGLRIGEALRLDWANIDWNNSSIFIAESKTGVPRTLVLHRHCRKALHPLFAARGRPRQGPVFLTNRGKPYNDPRLYKFPSGSPIKKAHATACGRAGIENFHVHDWRHHWASHCVMAGIDLETIKAEGGWKSLRMVERYADVSAAHRARAMAKLK